MATETDICEGRHGGSEHSARAFQAIAGTLPAARARVLSFIRDRRERGATTAEVAEALGCSPNDVSGRMTELKVARQIVPNLREPWRQAANGRRGAVWVVPDFGGCTFAPRPPAMPETGEGVRLPLQTAYRVAMQVVEALKPGCDRIQIAGSIRRKRPTIGDIEIVAIGAETLDLFGHPCGSLLNNVIDDLVRQGRLLPGRCDGPRYKQFGLHNCGLGLDLFLAHPANWGLILALRTGPAAFSQRLVTAESRGGLLREGLRVADGMVWNAESRAVPVPEEQDFFELAGGWVEPSRRESR